MLTNQNFDHSIQLKNFDENHKQTDSTHPISNDNNFEQPMIKKLGKYQFSLDQKLGSGMAGDVYVGINTENEQLVCVKVIDKQLFKTQEQQTMLQHQIKCQRLIECQTTIKIYEVFDQNPFCYIITEFCEGGDLYKLLQFTPNGLPEKIVKRIGLQIAQALKKLKQMQIIHRDIKPENILLRQQRAKLGDFGFAIQEKNLQSKQSINIGSPLYMSLEALQKNQYSYSSDVFSYGIVLYEMLHKVSPWECSNQTILKQKIKTEPLQFKQGVSSALQDLIRQCLRIEPQDRIQIESIICHEFFKSESEAIEQQLDQIMKVSA